MCLSIVYYCDYVFNVFYLIFKLFLILQFEF